MKKIFLWNGLRRAVASIGPYLADPLSRPGSRMLAKHMRRKDIPGCPWVGYGIGKGVTSPERDMSIFGVPKTVRSGLHGEMVKGLPDVDPAPLCYEDSHKKGFGTFVRWVFFSDPNGERNYLGVDFSLSLRETSGVATSFKRVAEVVRHASRHGIPKDTRIVLLNWRMCEPAHLTRVREGLGLRTVTDWKTKMRLLFFKDSIFCSKCGLETFNHQGHRFCYRCGAPRST